jgi:hypothetical protein
MVTVAAVLALAKVVSLAVARVVLQMELLELLELQTQAEVLVVLLAQQTQVASVALVTLALLIGHKEINNGTFNRVRTRIY